MFRQAGLLAGLALVGCIGCATAGRSAPATDPGTGASYAVYRATFQEAGEPARSFRVWLYASLPDRLHAELLPPVGGPAVVIDAGSGRLAVTFPAEGTAWAGEVDRTVVERVLGFPLDLEALVHSLLLGAPLEGAVAAVRKPARGEGLPRRFELEWSGRWLALELRKRRKVERLDDGVGTGTPPSGVEVRPLESLSSESGPVFRREG